jgi:hypothetical protein
MTQLVTGKIEAAHDLPRDIFHPTLGGVGMRYTSLT